MRVKFSHSLNCRQFCIFAGLLAQVVIGESCLQAQSFDWTKFVPNPGRANQIGAIPFLKEISPEELEQLEAVEISTREERTHGKQILLEAENKLARRRIRVSRQSRDVTYLQKLVATARPLMDNRDRYPSIRIGIIEADFEDAYSIPGGDLLFTRGLLEKCESEAAMVGVVCHELAHLDRGHQLYRLRKAKLASQSKNWLKKMNGLASSFMPFHPEFEKQADMDAVRHMLALKYDPKEFAHLLERWEQRQNQQSPWLDVMPPQMRSHPDAGVRVESVLAEYGKFHGDARQLRIGRENFKRRIPCNERTF